MIGLLQRVTRAQVSVAGEIVGKIGAGLLVLVGVSKQDDTTSARLLLQRLLDYRMFGDEDGRMNRSLRDIAGGLLLVPQFTLAADTRHGRRPGFSTAAPPAQAAALFDYVVEQACALHDPVATGRFGADMQVELVNDGPVTFWLETGSASTSAKGLEKV
jgi:D-aminoacyl-tRNA deacylase